jgi:hypothetical protein
VGTLRGSLGCDSPPKSVSKWARFWGFPSSRVRGVLGGISSIPPFWTSFGGIKLGYGLLGVSIIPKVLFKFVERFGRSKFGFGGVDPRVLFISSCPGYTGLTGATLGGFFCSGERLGVFAVLLCWGCFEFGSVWWSVGLFGDLGGFRLRPV